MSEQSFDQYDQQIHQKTSGIAFLGTPHQGSKLASTVSTLASISRVAGVKSSSRLFDSLQIGSQVLMDIEATFATWLRKSGKRLNIINFYEEFEGFSSAEVSSTSCASL